MTSDLRLLPEAVAQPPRAARVASPRTLRQPAAARMSDAEQPVESETTTLAVKSNASSMGDVCPKPEPKGHVKKSFDVDGLAIGNVVVAGKFVLAAEGAEGDVVRGLLDGSKAAVSLSVLPGSRARIYHNDFYAAGVFKDTGLTTRDGMLVSGGETLVGGIVSGVGSGRAKIYSPNEVYSGSVEGSKPSGKGVVRAADTMMRGTFATGGLPHGRFTVTSISDGSTYTATFEQGREVLAKRSKRRFGDYDGPDNEDEAENDKEEEDTVESLQDEIKALQQRLKHARKVAKSADGAAEAEATA